MTQPITTIGIIGAGTMGSALTQKFAMEGLTVRMIDREARFVERGLQLIRSSLDEGVQRKLFKPEQVEKILGRIHVSTDYDTVTDCQIVIEAVFEDFQIKSELFKTLSAIVPADTILATNTSSFAVRDLAKSVTFPERFIGLHFFYHAAKNRLVEVIPSPDTSDGVYRTTMLFMQRCGKDPITCADAHGFVVNRFFVPWLNESTRIVEEGLADAATIDVIYREAFGCGMGPFALMNATGVPVAYHSQRTLEDAFGAFYKPSELLRKQTEANQLWTIGEAAAIDSTTTETISKRILAVIFLVCAQLLEEKVCTAGDINRGARIGLKWQRGPVELYHHYGEEAVRTMITETCSQWDLPVPTTLSADNWKLDFVHSEVKGSTAIITITRPEDLNALNPTVAQQLAEVFDAVNDNPNIETIILTGSGKAFMAGADIKFFIDHIEAGTIAEIVAFTKFGQDLFQRIDTSGKKVIAVINGLALGGGLELALCADVIVALPNALFAFPETGIGIYPGLGGTQRSVERIGLGIAKQLIYTGMFVPAVMAKEIGLVDAVINWEEMNGLIDGSKTFNRATPQLSDKWLKTEAFFANVDLTSLMSGSATHDDLAEDEYQRFVKMVQKKAPIALREAERLLDARRGPASELECLEAIFRTNDALAGLKSVGKGVPVFTGS